MIYQKLPNIPNKYALNSCELTNVNTLTYTNVQVYILTYIYIYTFVPLKCAVESTQSYNGIVRIILISTHTRIYTLHIVQLPL